MASPVKEAKDNAQLIWPGAGVFTRGKGQIVHQHPTIADKFMIDAQVGGRGWHFGDGPFTDANEVDTAWVDADPILDAPWQKKMVLADYNAYAFREPTLGFDQGQLIEYRHPGSGEAVNFQPTQLQWTNDLDQISPIEDPQAVAATINDDMLTWADAYGSGIDFQWETQTARLMKYVNIDSLANLGAPPAFVIAGGNPVLRVELLFQKSAGVEIWVDGVLWDERSNNPQETLDNVEFRLAGQPLWWLKAPKAWDSREEDNYISPLMRLRKSGPNLFVEILTPWSWLETAVYPVVIDVTIDDQVGAGSGDADEQADGNNFAGAANEVRVFSHTDASSAHSAGFFFTDAPPQGCTVDTSYIETYWAQAANDDFEGDIRAHDVDTTQNFVDLADVTGRTLTTAKVEIRGVTAIAGGGATWYGSGTEIKTVIQEIVDRGGYDGANITIIYEGLTSFDGSDRGDIESYEQNSALAAKFHVEYTVAGGVDITVPVAALTLTGYVPTVATPVDVTVPVAALTLTGYAPTVQTPTDVEVPVAALTLTGYVPSVATPTDVEVPVAALTLTGYVPTVAISGNIDIEIPVAALTLTAYAPTVQTPTDIEIPVAALTLTGYAPTVQTPTDIEVPVAALTLTGYVPTVATTALVDIIVPVAALILTGYAPDVAGTEVDVDTCAQPIAGPFSMAALVEDYAETICPPDPEDAEDVSGVWKGGTIDPER